MSLSHKAIFPKARLNTTCGFEPPGGGSAELKSLTQFWIKFATPRPRDSWFAITEFISGIANWEHNAFATDVTIAPLPGGKRLLAMELNAAALVLGVGVVAGEITGVVGGGGGGGAVVDGVGGSDTIVGDGCMVVEWRGGVAGVLPHTTLVPVAIQGVPAGQHQLVLIVQRGISGSSMLISLVLGSYPVQVGGP